MRIHRDSKGFLRFFLRDNKNLGNRGTLVSPWVGEPTALSQRPTEWLNIKKGSICPQTPPPTSDPGPLQEYNAFKYSLQSSHIPDPPSSKELVTASSLKVILADAWMGALMGPAGATLQEFRRKYDCAITVSTRGHWHPNATDMLGRIVIFDAPQMRLDELFNNLFKKMGRNLG